MICTFHYEGALFAQINTLISELIAILHEILHLIILYKQIVKQKVLVLNNFHEIVKPIAFYIYLFDIVFYKIV